MEIMKENHNPSKYRVVEPYYRYIYNTTPPPNDERSAWKRKQEESKSRRNREFAGRMYLLEMAEATVIKSHQHGCLSMRRTRTANRR